MLLHDMGEALADAAHYDCAPDSPSLRTAYRDAFDAWICVSHLRFGPSEAGDRVFALALWPDTRGLIAQSNPVAGNAAAFAGVSIAARG